MRIPSRTGGSLGTGRARRSLRSRVSAKRELRIGRCHYLLPGRKAGPLPAATSLHSNGKPTRLPIEDPRTEIEIQREQAIHYLDSGKCQGAGNLVAPWRSSLVVDFAEKIVEPVSRRSVLEQLPLVGERVRLGQQIPSRQGNGKYSKQQDNKQPTDRSGIHRRRGKAEVCWNNAKVNV